MAATEGCWGLTLRGPLLSTDAAALGAGLQEDGARVCAARRGPAAPRFVGFGPSFISTSWQMRHAVPWSRNGNMKGEASVPPPTTLPGHPREGHGLSRGARPCSPVPSI